MRAETRLCSHYYEESLMLLPQLAEESLNLLALVSSMPGLRHVLEICLEQTIVAVMMEKATQRDSITKLSSRLELQRGPVDQVLDLHRLDCLAPFEELSW